MEKSQYIEAGKITNTHGVKGEVRIEVWLDSPAFLKRIKYLVIDGKKLRMLSPRVHKNMIITGIEGVDNVNDAMPLKNKTVYIDRDDAHLPAGGYFLQDIIGAEVVDENGNRVGILEEIMETPASNVYIVKGAQEHLIPAVPEFILNTDADKGIITVHLIEGM